LASSVPKSPPSARDPPSRGARGILLIGPVLKDRAAWLRYGVAVALVLGIGLARFALLPLLGPQAPLLPFVLAIYAAAYLGGLGPALFASGGSAVLATALFTAWPAGPHAQEWTAHVAFFLGVSVLVSLIMQQLQRAYANEHEALLAVREAERQASHSEAQLRLITDALPVLIASVDREHRYRFINKRYEEWFGRPREALLGRHPQEAWGHETYRVLEPYVAAALAGQPINAEAQLNSDTGGGRYISAHYIPDVASDGLVRGYFALVEDISERKRVEQALRQSEERLRLITDHLPALIAYIDRAQVYRFTNAAYTQWFEDAGSIVGRPLQQVLGETVYQHRRPYIQAVLGGELVSFVAPKRHRTLGVRECELTYVPDRESSTGVRGFYAMVRDVTERLQAERALQERERMLKLIYDNSSDSLFLAQREPEDQFRFVSVNEPFLRTRGLEREPVQGHLMEDSVPAANQALLRAQFHEAIRTRRAVVYEDVADLPAGRRHGEVTLTPILGDNDTVTHILGCVTDVTARKQAQDALQAADRRKDEFLSMLAHELRNPLAPIRNVAQILASGRVEADDVRRTGELLMRQTGQLARLLDDLLDVARITRGVIQLKKETVLLESVVDRAIETVQPLLSVKRQTVNREHASRSLVVNADAARLSQILENLLSNAAKYSADRSVIHVFFSNTPELASVHVRDEGSGIDPQILPHVFDLFMQADRSLDRAQGGLGVGLTIVKQLVHLHGGTVEAHSDGLGCGSEFIVRLPLQLVQTPALPATTEAPRVALGRRVLIVEDNVDSAESLAMLLSVAGHDVRTTHDGAAALQTLASFPAEWVLLDIGLPGMDGYLVAQAIRERYRQQPLHLYALSGYGRQEDRALALDSGFDGHLTKPVDPAYLLTLLAERDSSQPTAGVNVP
jgi:PAS domain S-box-containing protein